MNRLRRESPWALIKLLGNSLWGLRPFYFVHTRRFAPPSPIVERANAPHITPCREAFII